MDSELAMIFSKADRERLAFIEGYMRAVNENIVLHGNRLTAIEKALNEITWKLNVGGFPPSAKDPLGIGKPIGEAMELSHKDLQAGIISLKGQLDGIRDGLADEIHALRKDQQEKYERILLLIGITANVKAKKRK